MKRHEIDFPITSQISVKGDLTIPVNPVCLVIFVHGSSSSRLSARNRYLAEILNNYNIATLLTDLLTEREDCVYANRFDINKLTERLITITNFVIQRPQLKGLSVGYFGASTGAASALRAAVRLPETIMALVLRGGRPDLAANILPEVTAPTLLLVGSKDTDVIPLNKSAYESLSCEKELELITGAGHLFEEPGKLEIVADLSAAWFIKHLTLTTAPVKIL